jgi:hypothetical protein
VLDPSGGLTRFCEQVEMLAADHEPNLDLASNPRYAQSWSNAGLSCAQYSGDSRPSLTLPFYSKSLSCVDNFGMVGLNCGIPAVERPAPGPKQAFRRKPLTPHLAAAHSCARTHFYSTVYGRAHGQNG